MSRETEREGERRNNLNYKGKKGMITGRKFAIGALLGVREGGEGHGLSWHPARHKRPSDPLQGACYGH